MNGRMAECTKASTDMIRSTVMGATDGQMVENTMGIGPTAKGTGKEG